VQPVLPVPDVAIAVSWFQRVLGFDVDFMIGEPPHHARVKLGDRSWGDPIFIHLRHSAANVSPSVGLRLHVGHEIDGLYAHVVTADATVARAPSVQPWGLCEMVLTAPGGHLLVLAAEAAHDHTAGPPRAVIACYRPKPGQEHALKDLVLSHVPRLRALGLATEREAVALHAADGTVVEVFEWSSAQAIADAHQHPDVHTMWAEFAAACDCVPLSTVPEAQQMFAEFAPLGG